MIHNVQQALKAPKNKKNDFGGFSYRSAEGILEGLKPQLKKEKGVVTLSDEIVEVGGRIYVKATATYKDKDGEYVATAFAREQESRKGMDESQVTGSASSYARKYALCGLFAIDDGNDADSMDNRDQGERKEFGNLQGQITEKQKTMIYDLILATDTDEEKIENAFGGKIAEFSKNDASKCITMLKTKQEQK